MKEKKFRHKLNMLEAGAKMLKWIGILLVLGGILYLLHWKTAACCAAGISRVLFVLLVVLLAVESYQDKALNEIQSDDMMPVAAPI